MVEETRREDAVKAIVYEATARLRDPVYGSVRPIFHLQKMVEELKVQLESTRAQVLKSQEQRDQLLHHLHLLSPVNYDPVLFDGDGFALGDDDIMAYETIKFPVECDWII